MTEREDHFALLSVWSCMHVRRARKESHLSLSLSKKVSQQLLKVASRSNLKAGERNSFFLSARDVHVTNKEISSSALVWKALRQPRAPRGSEVLSLAIVSSLDRTRKASPGSYHCLRRSVSIRTRKPFDKPRKIFDQLHAMVCEKSRHPEKVTVVERVRESNGG